MCWSIIKISLWCACLVLYIIWLCASSWYNNFEYIYQSFSSFTCGCGVYLALLDVSFQPLEVTDVHTFRTQLGLFPLAKPYVPVTANGAKSKLWMQNPTNQQCNVHHSMTTKLWSQYQPVWRPLHHSKTTKLWTQTSQDITVVHHCNPIKTLNPKQPGHRSTHYCNTFKLWF